jgi:hypothetical protein
MPFTFSHPAIILPLAYLPKKWYSMTGLVIGSLVPDFEYFLRMSMAGYHSHTIAGLVRSSAGDHAGFYLPYYRWSQPVDKPASWIKIPSHCV